MLGTMSTLYWSLGKPSVVTVIKMNPKMDRVFRERADAQGDTVGLRILEEDARKRLQNSVRVLNRK